MTLFYPWPAGDGALLYVLRLLFGSAMVVSIVLGFTTIRRGDVMGHRVWMTRGYAIGLGAATQMLTLMAGELVAGPPTELSRGLLMGAGWVMTLRVGVLFPVLITSKLRTSCPRPATRCKLIPLRPYRLS
jgi:hypothetical protein